MTFWPQPRDLRRSSLEVILENRLRHAGLEGFVKEHYFARPRKWRFDFAWLEHHLAVEVEGGGFVNGRHVRGKGFSADLEKYAEAMIRGWCVLRVNGAMIESGAAVRYIEQLLGEQHRGRETTHDP